jgi:hypothetical protein
MTIGASSLLLKDDFATVGTSGNLPGNLNATLWACLGLVADLVTTFWTLD